MKVLPALLERIEGGFGRDKELDAAIECILPQSSIVMAIEPGLSNPGKVLRHYDSGSHGLAWSNDFTCSLDDAAGLAKRLLPGWRIRVQVEGDGTCEAFVENKGDFGAIDADATRAFASSPERALVSAVLKGWDLQREARS